MVDRNSGSGRNAVIFFALALAFRGLGLIQHVGEIAGNGYRMFAEFILPLLFCALMVLSIVVLGKKHFWVSILPVVIGELFLILRIVSEDNILGKVMPEWGIVIRVFLYLLVFALYSGAVLRNSKMKWALIPLLILGLGFHLVAEDYPALFGGETALSFSSVMMEFSILFIALGMIFLAFAFTSGESREAEKTRETKKTRKKPFSLLISKWKNFFASLKKQKKTPPETENAEKPAEKPAEERTENAAPAENPEDVPAMEDRKEKPLDESYFDKPYTASLTLDPQSDTDKA